MMIFWNIFFWLSLVAIVSIIAWTIVVVVTKNAEARKYIADAQHGGNYKALADESQPAANRISEQLTALDGRLATIEKTLTDIP